ncbi:hypothetical protein D3C75_453120 [compost metagenome]
MQHTSSLPGFLFKLIQLIFTGFLLLYDDFLQSLQRAQITSHSTQSLKFFLLQPKPEVKVSFCPKDMQQVLQLYLPLNQPALNSSDLCNPCKLLTQLIPLFSKLPDPVRTLMLSCPESLCFPDELDYTVQLLQALCIVLNGMLQFLYGCCQTADCFLHLFFIH